VPRNSAEWPEASRADRPRNDRHSTRPPQERPDYDLAADGRRARVSEFTKQTEMLPAHQPPQEAASMPDSVLPAQTPPPRVLLTGGSGQLGSAIIRAAKSRGMHVVAPSSHGFGVTWPPAELHGVVASFLGAPPKVVVHCAAIADWRVCHDQPRVAMDVNAVGAFNVARLCERLAALMVYVSTDAVFPGTYREGVYTEEDTPTNPVSVYGISKLAGEHLVVQTCKNLIVRVGWLFSDRPATDKKFVGRILRQAAQGNPVSAVTDKVGSPAFARQAPARPTLSVLGSEQRHGAQEQHIGAIGQGLAPG
jgi:dTDP-4-dehydrorhamnose reductase